ncbi:MAG TPA: hypothetical protein PKY05_19030, partial [Fibrobacteria bacterium]|nr:hypothetical protein [Fibrobacteria bacterium]
CVAGTREGALTQTGDGVRWMPVDGVPPGGYWSDIEWIHDRFLAVGLYGWGVSSDGVHWEFRESNMSRQSWTLVGAAWTGREFLVVGSRDSALVSRDGTAWDAVPFGCQASRSMGSHTASGGGSVVVAFDNGAGCVSSDSGRTWKEVIDTLDQPFGGFHAVGWNGSRFLALAQDQIWASDDGLRWKLDLWGKYLVARAFHTDSSADLALGREAENATSAVWRRPRGGVWARVDTFSSQLDLTEFARGPFGYLALGMPSHRLASPDGRTWTASGPDPDYFAVVHALGRFHAVGGGGRAIASADGIAWTVLATGSKNDLPGIATDGKRLVAVGDSGTILVSDDGLSWKSVVSGTRRLLRSVAWNGRRFLVVGDSATVLGSVDGAAWTPESTAPAGNLLRVVAGDGAWYVMDAQGAIWTQDASAWRDLGLAAQAQMVGAADGRGIVVQDRNGGNWWSRDGADWVRPTLFGSVSPAAVVHTGSEWI